MLHLTLQSGLCSSADSCLAQETLQRAKGDAKQSTLQRFAPVSKQTSTAAAPRQLRRSLTAATATEPAKQKRKARRSSSDSALLLRGGQQQPHAAAASRALDDDSGELLPNRLLKPKSGPGHPRHVSTASTPAAFLEAHANTADLPNTPQLPSPPPTSPACVHIQTSIVGRRFRTNISCTRHTQLALARQPDNPRDSNAIQIVDTARQAVLGYLPREIAQHLAGLLDTGSVQVTATADEPKSVAASAPILLEVLLNAAQHLMSCALRLPFDIALHALWQCFCRHHMGQLVFHTFQKSKMVHPSLALLYQRPCYLAHQSTNPPWLSCLGYYPGLSTLILPTPPAATQISCTHSQDPQAEAIKQTLETLVRAAADWQAAGLQRQGSNTGACLRTNFLLMADIVVTQDGHLLVEEEKQLLQRFQVPCTAYEQSRMLRLNHVELRQSLW